MQEAFANNLSNSSRQKSAPNFNHQSKLPSSTHNVSFIPPPFNQNSQNSTTVMNNLFAYSQPPLTSNKQQHHHQQQQFFRPQPFSPEKNRQFDKQNRNYNNQRNSDFGGNRPKGPHTLNTNDNMSMGNGAFIPLQAARKASSKKQNQKNDSAQPAAAVSDFVQRNNFNRQTTQQAQEQNQQDFAKFLGIVEKENKATTNVEEKAMALVPDKTKTIQHGPRTSRIAARFPAANN